LAETAARARIAINAITAINAAGGGPVGAAAAWLVPTWRRHAPVTSKGGKEPYAFQPQSLRMTFPFFQNNDISNMPLGEGLLHLAPIVRFITIRS